MTMFTAPDIATGKGIAKCKAWHGHHESLVFLRLVDEVVPVELNIHLDSYATHKHVAMKRWLVSFFSLERQPWSESAVSIYFSQTAI